MDVSRFEQLIQRLEEQAARAPRRYRLRVAGVALLGFLILAVTVGLSLSLILTALIGLVALAVKGGGGAALLAVKLGKGLLILAVPMWLMLKTSAKLLFVRFPEPRGIELGPTDAPGLFTRLREMRERMKGPAVHHVLIVDDLNAAVVQRPLFGLVGFNRNYLLLGMPLLQTLTEQEALAVVAHEYGHLAGNHGRFGAFIYRLRNSWAAIHAIAQGWRDWGSMLVGRLFTWYAPYFNAYSFVLARANEYQADRSSAELVGVDSAASALMRVNIAARFSAAEFWPGVDRRARVEPRPVEGLGGEWAQAVGETFAADRAGRYLGQALELATDYADTHPALADRLRALGVSFPHPGAAGLLGPVGESAAQVWLGETLPRWLERLDAGWRERVAGQWQKRHEYLAERMRRLEVLTGAQATSVEEELERIDLIAELEPEQDTLPMVQALLERQPDHLGALYRRGRLRLVRGDEAGIADLEAVMGRDDDAILPGCVLAYQFYAQTSPDKAEPYLRRWAERNAFLQRVRGELNTLGPTARLAAADLPAEVVARVTQMVRARRGRISRAYLVRRLIQSDTRQHAYVVAYEIKRPWWLARSAASAITSALAADEWPIPVHILFLGHRAVRGFRKQIKALGVTPLPL